ncbi:MAG: hypothetical protein ACKOOL_04570 [Novosphingobium sp.]
MRITHALSAAASTLAIGIAALPGAAYAQSTGSQDAEKDIVVTGTRGPQQVAGVSSPDTPKAKAVLTNENLARANPGQTVLDTINQIPGVSFQNNDASARRAARSTSAASTRPASASPSTAFR